MENEKKVEVCHYWKDGFCCYNDCLCLDVEYRDCAYMDD